MNGKAHKNLDYSVLFIVIGLVLFGILMVFSASYYTYQAKSDSTGYAQLLKQLQYAVVGFAVMLIAMFFDYHWFRLRIGRFPLIIWGAIALSMVLLVLALIIGENTNGANRWIEVAGISIQPSEIARFAMLLFTADWLAIHKDDLREMRRKKIFWRAMLPLLLVAGMICGGILSGKSLSMTACAGLLFIVLLYVAGVDKKFLILALVGAVLAGTVAILAEGFRINRVTIFRDPWKDPQDTGFQLVQSLYALGAGGLFGKGLGNGTQKLLYLTYGDSDFILANIGEELGFVGITVLLLIFVVLIWRGLVVAVRAPDTFGMLMAAGITSIIAIQVIINVAVVTSSMPPTGVPLPFISAGGTSLIMFLGEVGILLNISRQSVRS
jgi:cell division protein FtsW